MSVQALLLGLDGATLDLIEPWGAAGMLPNLSSLMQAGSYGKLRSTQPATTPLAWPSVYTGANPGKHGILGFQMRQQGSYDWRKSSSADLRRPTLWDVAAKDGARSGVFFVPYTFPAQPFDGALVAGRGAPRRLEARLSHPDDLARNMAAEFGEKALFGPRRSRSQTLQEVADALVESVDQQTDALCWALKQDAFDLFFTVWDHTDTAIHLFWHYSEPVPEKDSPLYRVYEAVDRGVGRVLETAGGDPLVAVCSDHGARPVQHKLHLPVWLAQNGYMQIKQARQKRLKKAMKVWRRLPTSVKRRVPVATRQKVVNKSLNLAANQMIEWPRTRMYPQPVTAEAVYANVAGREPDGAVPPDALDALLAEVSDKLKAVEAEDGTRIVRATLTRDEVYSGPAAELGADLVIETEPGAMIAHVGVDRDVVISTPARPRLTDRPSPVGYHDPDGIIFLSGPGVRRGAELRGKVEDVMPTVLRAMGVALPRDLDGGALVDAFDELPDERWLDDTVTFDKRDESGLSPEEEADVDKHLKELGYIE